MLPKLTFAHFAEKLSTITESENANLSLFHEVNKHTIVVSPIPNLI